MHVNLSRILDWGGALESAGELLMRPGLLLRDSHLIGLGGVWAFISYP
jgi:hypothetical protein